MIVTLTGPSCAGKSTLEAMLVERGFSNAISTTTRAPRAGDVDGETYYFVDRIAFEDGLNCDAFVEHVEFGGNYYGLAVAEVNRLRVIGKPIVVVCEPIGQKQIAKWCEENGVPLYAVFVDNPVEVIAKRFLIRFSEDEDTNNGIDYKTVDSYSRRMAEMVTTERAWRNEAWGFGANYNLRLSEFNEGNDALVADMIAEVASHN